jgi:hypothetical protein
MRTGWFTGRGMDTGGGAEGCPIAAEAANFPPVRASLDTSHRHTGAAERAEPPEVWAGVWV